VSLMNACRSIERGTPLGPQLLFSGFASNLRSLLTLGAIYLAAVVAILGLSALADDGALMAMMLAGQKPDAETVSSGSLLLATEIALVLLCPLIMAYWYAPVLAGWHGLSPAKALFFSFVACLRNWRPFLVYSLAIGVVATLVPGIVLGILAALLPSGASLVLVLMMVLLILVLAPTLFASFYVSYRDVFVSADDDA